MNTYNFPLRDELFFHCYLVNLMNILSHLSMLSCLLIFFCWENAMKNIRWPNKRICMKWPIKIFLYFFTVFFSIACLFVKELIMSPRNRPSLYFTLYIITVIKNDTEDNTHRTREYRITKPSFQGEVQACRILCI